MYRLVQRRRPHIKDFFHGRERERERERERREKEERERGFDR
jgi:hypothetical protein